MALDESQIRSWLQPWLKAKREAAGMTQDQAIMKSGLTRGVLVSAEQGRVPEVWNFLSLILFYGGEKELVNQLRKWREAGGEGAAGSDVMLDPEPDVPRRGPPVLPPTPRPRPSAKKAGGRGAG